MARRGFGLRLAYEHPDLGDDPREDALKAADLRMARNIGGLLETTYPGHPWFVEVSHAQGVVMISLPALMGQNRYVVKLHELKSDPGMKAIVRGCGEILERYRLPRAGFSPTEFQAALRRHPIYRNRNAPVPE